MSDTFPVGTFFAACGLVLVVLGFSLAALLRSIAEKGLRESTYSREGAARVVLIGTQILRTVAGIAIASSLDPQSMPLTLRIATAILGVAGVYTSWSLARPAKILVQTTPSAQPTTFAIADDHEARVRLIILIGAALIAAAYAAIFIVAAHRDPHHYGIWIAIAGFIIIVSFFSQRRFTFISRSPEDIVRDQPTLSIEQARRVAGVRRIVSAFSVPLLLLIVVAIEALFVPPLVRDFVNGASEPQTIPARFPGTVLVPTTVNTKHFWFALDTADPGIEVDPRTESSADAHLFGKGPHGLNFAVGAIRGEHMRFGAMTAWIARDGTRVSGILGKPFFDAAVTSIDFEQNELVVYPSGSFHPGAGAISTPISFFRGLPLVQVQIDGQRRSMLLDTRLNHSAILNASVSSPHIISATISFGGTTFPHRQIFEAPPAYWAGTKVEGRLCRDVLQYFRVTLDYANKVVYLER